MRLMKTASLVVCFALSVPLAFAQSVPRAEVFGGYSYMNFDTKKSETTVLFGTGIDRLNMHGWEASLAVNANRWLAVEADFSGHYKPNCGGVSGLTCKDLSFLFGPKVTYRKEKITGFAHALFGGDNGGGSFSGFSLTDTPFAFAVGGGVDYALTKSLSVRVAQVDYFSTRHVHNLFPSLSPQNNIRVSAGVVFRFGHTKAVSERPTTPTSAESQIPQLGVAVVQDSHGIKVAAVTPGSPAEAAGLTDRDYIFFVDGNSVHTINELNASLVGKSTVKLGIQVNGVWMTDKIINLK